MDQKNIKDQIKSRIKAVLQNEHIHLSGVCRLADCKINKPYLLEKAGISDGSAIVFAIPYFSKASLSQNRNISAYAVCKDYHAYSKALFSRLEITLSSEFPSYRFACFADHSPIDERDAAVKCGIGFFGQNGLLISDEYSSYMFIAEIITDAILQPDHAKKSPTCLGCGKCRKACPMSADSSPECLSAITQKKGDLSDFEIGLMKKYNTFWGCDICQEVCPHTKKAIENGTIFSPIPFFSEDTTPHLTRELIEKMPDEDFKERAYSWRGRAVPLRNLQYSNDSNDLNDFDK